MADSPTHSEQNPQQRGLKPFPKGVSGNPGGRPKLPEWLAGRSEKALLYIADVADGTEPAEPELRLKAAQIIVERYYGKAKEQVEHSGEVAHTESRTVVFVRAAPSEKVVAALTAAPAKGALDAE